MAKKFSQLACELNDGKVALRFKKSQAFLSGEDTELDLGGSSQFVRWFCRILFWVGLVALIALLLAAFYIWMWDASPLSDQVEATVTNIDKKSQGGVVSYQYQVGQTEHSATQYANSLKKKWQVENPTALVTYLKFSPGTSKLTKTVERMDWSMLIIGPILPLGFILGGWLGAKELRRMITIENDASHILNGEVTALIKSKGTVIVQYKSKSPVSDAEIFGAVQLGKLDPMLKQVEIGTPVAVIYKDEKEHTLL